MVRSISTRALFLAELEHRGVRRCRSYGLCGAGGFVLGLLTGMLGRQFIAATTVAVERVVLDHLRLQLQELSGQDERAVAVISAIVEEEQQHHDQSASHLSGYRVRPRLIGACCFRIHGVRDLAWHADMKPVQARRSTTPGL